MIAFRLGSSIITSFSSGSSCFDESLSASDSSFITSYFGAGLILIFGGLIFFSIFGFTGSDYCTSVYCLLGVIVSSIGFSFCFFSGLFYTIVFDLVGAGFSNFTFCF